LEDDLISRLASQFEAYESATYDARQEAERARDYRDGNQLTSKEVTELKRRGQPPVVNNRVRRKIEWLKGLEVKQRTDPKAFPRSPQHAEGAECATDAIRFVCDNNDWDTIRSDVYDNFLVEGFGGVEVVHEQGRRGVEVALRQYPWDRLFYDPHSRRPDFSDARYKGVVIWLDEDDFLAENPKGKAQLESLYTESRGQETHDDRPSFYHWADPKRRRVRIFLTWYKKDGGWYWCKWIKGHKLDGGQSPYVDEDGLSVCPLIMQASHVGRDNERYGIVRDMFDIQDEINKRRSKALFGISSRQTMGVKGAVDSVTDMKRELAKADGHIEITAEALEDAARVGMRPFEIIPTNDQIAAQMQLMQEAKEEIDMLGANAALAGETGESASGRAVLARQQGGMIEIASLSDKLHSFTREVYRHIWMRIKQFWTEERWVRVTDDEAGARFVGLNRPITLEEALGKMPPEQAQMVAMQARLVPGDPRLQAPVGVENSVEELDVDIVIEEVPDRVTLEGEIFEALMKYGPTLPPQVLIEADPVLPQKKKEKLLEMLQQAQANPAGELQTQGMQAQVAKTQAEAEKTAIEAQRLASGY